MTEQQKPPLKIKMPIELAGLKGRMTRAISQERAIADVGKRYDRVQDRIDEQIGAHQEHAGALETYEDDLRKKIEGMVGSNGGDFLEDGQGSGGQDETHGQIIEGTKVG